ncbi:uncharacterized protein I303_105481 [Kwoniella dejecticola CBS 10117]|uniref:Uncharacterized protein n=1 Tax=Kwoniella dejecticola CBS 10117 TaxID=1296121 RepID=A0A1A6A2F0_9TREE|nr:uncharacterized protein I303_05076 [Kwoniella dejecticola CBS 10117]OBR84219.1 hypothetical protein I303_05076 [Kwoniella dejecticola CBS 10117]
MGVKYTDLFLGDEAASRGTGWLYSVTDLDPETRSKQLLGFDCRRDGLADFVRHGTPTAEGAYRYDVEVVASLDGKVHLRQTDNTQSFERNARYEVKLAFQLPIFRNDISEIHLDQDTIRSAAASDQGFARWLSTNDFMVRTSVNFDEEGEECVCNRYGPTLTPTITPSNATAPSDSDHTQRGTIAQVEVGGGFSNERSDFSGTFDSVPASLTAQTTIYGKYTSETF